jgi:transposase
VLETRAGLKLTQGAITQDALRRARGQVGIAYQQLRRAVRESPAVYTDDTGWRVDGQNAHLMAFDTDEVTVYQIRPRHRHQEVQEVVPAHYPGVMVTGRGRSYEAHSFRKVRQQKCLAHLQKTLSTLLEQKKVYCAQKSGHKIADFSKQSPVHLAGLTTGSQTLLGSGSPRRSGSAFSCTPPLETDQSAGMHPSSPGTLRGPPPLL